MRTQRFALILIALLTPIPAAPAPAASPGVGSGCSATPRLSCTRSDEPEWSRFRVRDAGARVLPNSLLWRWRNDSAESLSDFGNPLESTAYSLCVYGEGAGETDLRLQVTIPPGGTCNGQPCWSRTLSSFRYRNPLSVPTGITSISLKSPSHQKDRIVVVGAGPAFDPPPLPLPQDPRVIVQLQNDFDGGRCWEAVYSAPAIENDENRFKDSGDPPAPTPTRTATATRTPRVPTVTRTPTVSRTPSNTRTPKTTRTATATASSTTSAPPASPTHTPPATASATATNTPTDTPTATPTSTMTTTPTDPPTTTPTDTPTTTPTNTPPATATRTFTPTPLPLICGDGIVNLTGGETCDDGNTLNGDACPADCRIEPCQPSGQPLCAQVFFTTTDPNLQLIGLTVFAQYPDGVVDVPGLGGDQAVLNSITSDIFAVTPTDFDYGTNLLLLDPLQLGYGSGTLAAEMVFDRCQGAPLPQAGDFTCTVTDAVDTTITTVTNQVSCVVQLGCEPTPTPTATNTPTDTPTATTTPTDTPPDTPIPTDTPTNTPTDTSTPTDTPTATFTPTNTPTHTNTTSPTVTQTFTPTPLPLICGDGVVNVGGGETCDDGNTLNGDACPADCRIEPCQPSGQPLTAQVIFNTTDPELFLIGLTVFVEYPDGVVDVPGLGGDQAVINSILSDFFAVTPTDFDYGTKILLLDPLFIGYEDGTVAATMTFDRCQGAPLPQPSDFTCTVTDAVDIDINTVTNQVSCVVQLAGAATPTPTLSLSTPTATNTPPPTATFTTTPTPTPPGAACGNGFLEAGEDCVSCPADCVVQSCSVATPAPTVSFRVDLIPPPGQAPTGATVLMGYNSALVSIPGTGNAASVRQRVVPPAPLPQSFSVNDLDYAVRVVITRNTTLGHLFTARFDTCSGAPPALSADFGCIVEGCAGGAGPITGCTCTVSVP